MYNKVNPKQSFPKLEEEMLKFWKEERIFEESMDRPDAKSFDFYDGPPFATGTPHYGHILAGTIKDVIPRYQTMLGKRVERRFGWDTHGLPIENIVEKKMGINGREDIEKIGVHAFNEECRANVFGYVDDWRKTVERMGRWVDMDNDYKTMDTDFMESVWWVFKSVHDKGLIYEGNRIVPYCPRCTTPLSNFEVNQGYKDKQSKTVTVKFRVIGTESKYLLAWTTTPWTIPSVLALAVGEDILYSEILDKSTGETYILANNLIGNYYKNEDDYKIISEIKGSCLVGTEFEPAFDDFKIQLGEMAKDLGTGIKLGSNSFKVVLGHHVTTEAGTGIVTTAPGYGEDDYIVAKEHDCGFVTHLNDSAKVYNLLNDEWNGMFAFDFNDVVLKYLKDNKKTVHIGTIDHSYPHCWRCDTPLIYRAISAWYVAVEKIRDKMVANNLTTHWTPESIKTGRFGKWLEGARDWNISRNRYWGSAIPVWQSEDKKSEVVIGSIAELYEANKDYGQIEKKKETGVVKYYYTNTGEEIDIHKHFVDEIYLENKDNLTIKKENSLTLFFASHEEDENDFNDMPYEHIHQYNGTYFSNNPNEVSEKLFKLIENKESILIYGNLTKFLDQLNLMFENGFFSNKEFGNLNYKIPRITFYIVGLFKITDGEIELFKKNKNYVKEFNIISTYIDNNTNNQNDAGDRNLYNNKEILKNLGINYTTIDSIKNNTVIKNIILKGTPLKRIPEVLDCWFESGSMPYASNHFPFENKDKKVVPADFIAEGLDQTRGWFYTLIILSTALFDSPATKNTIVNGIILAEDGKKMSKSLQNYPDPTLMFDKYGADAIRFYLMNSPVTEGQDFRFAESGVEEVVKKIILPLWNTYSFFTTYANIDKFEAKKGAVYFVRHGETDNNKFGIVNGGNDDVDLNETGIKQAQIAGEQIKASGIKYDKIISSPMLKATHTAKHINDFLGQNLEIEIVEGLREMDYGKFKGRKVKDISNELGISNNSDAWSHIFGNSGETLENFMQRVNNEISRIEEKNTGKNILIIGHAGTFKAISAYNSGVKDLLKAFQVKPKGNASIHNLSELKHNPLDKWLISELNKLIKEVKTGFDEYKLADAARPLQAFMDNLTNWYIRRSRKRFWKSESDSDKTQAYETLHFTLVEISKIIAPFMPFISDSIYKNLTANKSVHLDMFPEYDESLIDEELSIDMAKTQKIINLGLAWRVNHKLKVRQPLKSITIGENLSEYYKNILKEELNVKEVIDVDGEVLAKKICKPNGRNIGPKFGKDVKFIMNEAKSGNFKELENGNVKVGDFELEAGDFELVFEAGDSNYEIEAGFGMVIAMDPNLTDDLIQEGLARDLVRFIQEARKEAKYNVEDRIKIEIIGDDLDELKNNFGKYIESETLSSLSNLDNGSDLEKELEFPDKKIIIKLKK